MLERIKEALRRRSNMKATIKELHSLTDAELRDIGITRGNIEEVCKGVIEFHRTVRDGRSG